MSLAKSELELVVLHAKNHMGVVQDGGDTEEARAELDLARQRLNEFLLMVPEDGLYKAPVDGRALDIHVQPGDQVLTCAPSPLS